MKKKILVEVLIIIILIAITFAIIGYQIGFNDWRGKSYEIQLHDTYFVLSIPRTFFILFFNLAFWLFFVRQVITRFRDQVSNVILMLVTGILIFIQVWIMQFTATITSGWEIYPPNAEPQIHPSVYNTMMNFNPLLQVYEVLLILVLAGTGIAIGRKIQK